MGVETAILAAAAAAVGAGASIYGGYQQNKNYKSEAGLLEDEGRLIQKEAARDAQLKAEEVRKFATKQKLAFLKNGVTLEGSPLLVIDDTIAKGQEEVNAITERGNAAYNLRFRQADIAKNQGRAALIGGFGQAANIGLSATSYYNYGKKGKG